MKSDALAFWWVVLELVHFNLFHLIVVTWLILPVVICLSQRLSHACLSINIFIQ
jgi:hypothetical protein